MIKSAGLAVVVFFAIVACARRDEAAVDTAVGATSAAATAPAPTMSDGNIVALFDEVNVADSSLGAIAATKATRAEVRQFAQRMMGEHHALREKGLEMARKPTGALPPWPKAEAPSVDPFAPAVDDAKNALNSTPKGAAFDSTYIAREIAIHQAALDWANQAAATAQHQELKGVVQSAVPILQKHLTRAQEIQRSLSGTGTKTP